MTRKYLAGAAIAAIAAATLPSSVRGQTAASERDAVEVPEIIVTAQRREQAITDVPLAVTALSGEAFEEAGFDTIDDLAEVVPSLTFGSSATARGEGLVIRGFGTTSFSDAAEGAVGIVVDGVVLGRQAAGLLDLVDIERVEVLRGPQGTLFGKIASAGVVNIVTKRPTADFEAEARALYGSDNEFRLGASLSGPFAGDSLSARLTGFYNQRDGILNQLNPDFPISEVNDEKEWGVRGKLLFQPSNALDILVTGEYQKQDVLCCNWTARQFATDGPFAAIQQATLGAFVDPGPGNRDVALTIRSNFQESETTAATVDVDLQIGDHSLRSISGYRSFDISEGNKTDQLPISFFDLAATDSEIEQFSQELQLLSPDDGPLTYVAGLYLFNLQVDSVQRQEAAFVVPAPGVNIPAPLAPFLLPPEVVAAVPPSTLVNIQNQSQETWNYAAFFQASYELSDKLTATGGARVIREELDVFFDRSGGLPLGAFGQTIAGISDDTNDTAVTGMASLQYQFAEEASAYFTYSRGYKGRAYDLNAGSPVVFDENGDPVYEPLDNETVDHFEIGLRGRALDRKLQFGVTAFRTEVQDYQAASQRTDGIPGFVLSNVGEFRTQGVEVELTARPSAIFEAGANFSYVDAEYVDFPNAECPPANLPNRPASCAISNTQDLSGAPAANSPDWSGFVYGTIYTPLASTGWQAVLRGELSFRSDTLYSLTQDPNTIQDGYELVNARLSLNSPDDRFELALWGRNLFDVDYADSIFSTPVVGGYSQFIANDRQIGVELRTSF
ncbi:MAG: TonB-dependent receptor [Pacificimonas sp.]